MSDKIKFLKNWLGETKEKLSELLDKKEELEKKIKHIENLIALEEGHTASPDTALQPTGKLADKSGMEAYKNIVETDFRDRVFREHEIREFANKHGLRVRRNPISATYSRSILKELVKNGILKRPGRGQFKFVKHGEIEEKSEPSLPPQSTISPRL